MHLPPAALGSTTTSTGSRCPWTRKPAPPARPLPHSLAPPMQAPGRPLRRPWRTGATPQQQPHDLSALWEEHCKHEFDTRRLDATMDTMVEQPYVNHVPTLTGGVGQEEVRRFYKYHFIGNNPPDFELSPVSRTVGSDQLVDELIVKFTHTTEIDWMLPGVAPTGKRVEVPLVAIVRFRGGKVAHEHIYWDQASVLVQVGLLQPGPGMPVAGIESARKVVDESLPSNQLMARWASSEGKPIR